MTRVLTMLATLLTVTGTLVVLAGGAASADPTEHPVMGTSNFHCSE